MIRVGPAIVALALVGCAPGTAPGRDSDSGTATGAVVTIAYGELPDQVGDLHLPPGATDAGPVPVVILIHGGFWQDGFRRDLMAPLARDLVERGYAVWNLEYRRLGSGGGYPETFLDVAAGVDHLAEVERGEVDHLAEVERGEVDHLAEVERGRIDLSRVAVVGHSAGGHLALWAAGRGGLPAGVPGAKPAVVPVLAVSQAGVTDLPAAHRSGVGGGTVAALLGAAPDEVPDRVARTSPAQMLPTAVPQVVVHGTGDDIVPPVLSEDYAAAVAAVGGTVDLVLLAGDHFDAIDPAHPLWAAVVEALDARLAT